MKWGRVVFATLGVVAGTLLILWWVNGRRVPTLRFSHTLGRGNEVSIEWIQIK
jgi:hypothetical protein